MRVLQDGLGGGFPCSMSTAGVHTYHQRLLLLRAAAHTELQGGAELERVQRNHAVIMIRRQEENRWVRGSRVRRLRQVVERRIPAGMKEK